MVAGNIRNWLTDLGLGEYAEAFEAEQVDMEALAELEESDLKNLGIPLGPRKKMLKALRAEEPAPATARREAERRQITVMFCDLVGSTALSEKLDPEDLREVMAAYQKAAGAVIERYDGHVAQYLGDGLMTYFGWPQAHEDDAERAVRAGLEIVEAVKTVTEPEPLQVRVGIATGPVVVGETSTDDASVPSTAIGETPNLAARMQSLANPGEVIVAPATYRLVRGVFTYEERGGQSVKGIAEPVLTRRVLGEAAVEGRFEAASGASLTPLVGRETEIAMLMERWRQACDGEGQVVLLCGEPGIGKSRITQTLRQRISEEPHARLRYQCSPYHTNSALHPMIEQMERAAGFERDDDTDAKLAKLEDLVGSKRSVPALFASLLSLEAGERYPPLAMNPQKQKEETLRALGDRVAALSARQPVLMIFEDAHWIDPTSQEVLDLLVPQIAARNVLLVVTCRPEYEPPWSQGLGHLSTLSLTRLARARVEELIDRVSGGKPLPEPVVREIAAKTDGVPLFVEELTKTVLESGLVVEDEASWRLAGPFSGLSIPSTLHDSLMARLDRLAPVKEVAQTAACIGREFTYPLLAAVSSLDHEGLQDALGQLTEAELIYASGAPPEATYTFKHALVQDAAYGSLLRSRRQQLHGSIADVLVNHFQESVDAEPEVAAHHLSQADRSDSALTYWLSAGEKAMNGLAFSESAAHFAKALECFEKLSDANDKDRLEVRIRGGLAPANFALYGWADKSVLDGLPEAFAAARRVGDVDATYRFLHYQAVVHGNRCDFEKSSPIVSQLLNLTKTEEFERFSVMANASASAHYTWTGDFSSADQCYEHVLDHYHKEKHRSFVDIFNHDPLCFAYSWRGHRLWMQGFSDQSKEAALKQIEWARQFDHPFNLIWSLTGGVLPYLFCGEAETYNHFVEEAREVAIQQGLDFLDESVCSFWHGMGLVASSQWRDGLEQLTQGVSLWRDSGGFLYVPLAQSMMAQALDRLGDHGRAIGLVNDTLSEIESTGHRTDEIEVKRTQGELLRHRDGKGQRLAAECFEEALLLAKKRNLLGCELKVCLSLARLQLADGDKSCAHALLAPVFDRFTEGFDTHDLQEARRILDETSD